jgi:hypothetical protein
VIAQGVIHQEAGGTGTYCDPITFATEVANDAQFPFGTIIYVPPLKRYFIREDTCAGCTGPWFDLWVGGDGGGDSNAVIACEEHLPGPTLEVLVNPPSDEPVTPGPIFQNGTCGV